MICWCAMVIVLAATALAETCTELRESCNTQSDYKWSSQSQDDLRNLPWPATNEDYAPYRVLADEFCRKQNATAHCKKDLIARCPDDPYLLARALSYGPYSIEWSLSMLALCQSDINPLRYLRAERHCRQLTREVEFQLHGTLNRRLTSAMSPRSRVGSVDSCAITWSDWKVRSM
ncbi:uncharacterized protein LOC129601542 [Paramacrobiotus metropolitanus]|uniref:uncharacterized protein LOC129601542 n=1 Tax=Paramacrobiotus metropolitanus TaxID=2943436 RepID=UPI0024458849|nr:uncharacterized protein LOC129601542 [Paramacrobiotus metropolitanus]